MPSSTRHDPRETSSTVQAALVGFGLAAPFATYLIAVSQLDQAIKVVLLVGLSVLYAGVCIWSLSKMRSLREVGPDEHSIAGGHPPSELEQKLLALEDASEFFGTSLKPADMFRLVANRINGILPFAGCALFIKDSETASLRTVHAYGANSKHFEGLEISADESLAGLAFYSGEIEITRSLDGEKGVFPLGLLDGLRSAAAIPLTHDGETFAVLQLFLDQDADSDDETLGKLHAISERISPLFLGSLAFERSFSNALTDPLTKLPNERAFQLVLENQLAESMRFRDERPLTVLAVDIRNFEEINRGHGHGVGDRALAFVADKIATQLRKMDFLARSMNDEFLVVLPKATERIAIEITGRIQATLATTPLIVNDEEHLKLWLNFGWATFWQDGETPQQLINSAFTRKQQMKSEEPDGIVLSPKEYVH